MKLYKVTDPEFKAFGKVITGYDTSQLAVCLSNTPSVSDITYTALDENLQSLPFAKELETRQFGGMPIQLGWCNGCNTFLNALEYHRSSEVNFGATDFVLQVAHQHEIHNNTMETSKTMAFLCPKHTLIEVYATTLHFAPCSGKKGENFQVLIALPLGTNTEKTKFTPVNEEDKLMTAKNKWLIAHPDSKPARNGAHIGLIGENINIESLI